MKGWINLCSDVNWVDYHGMWARKAPDGSWYVLRWTNMIDACGDEAADRPYDCDVLRVDLKDVPEDGLKNAMQCVDLSDEDLAEATEESREMQLVYACVSYGLSSPIESFGGEKYPERIRAQARRYAEEVMGNETKLNERLDRPVNAIGSTAREFGRGDLDSALHRGDSTAHQILRKMHGIPEGPRAEFGTLQADGTLANVRRIRHADIRRCKFSILVPEHYREDGSCRCDDAEHRQKMIAEWEYSEKDFEGIPLRS